MKARAWNAGVRFALWVIFLCASWLGCVAVASCLLACSSSSAGTGEETSSSSSTTSAGSSSSSSTTSAACFYADGGYLPLDAAVFHFPFVDATAEPTGQTCNGGGCWAACASGPCIPWSSCPEGLVCLIGADGTQDHCERP